jgi:putative membrane protein
MRATTSRFHVFLLASLAAIFVWSGIHPKDTFTWILEVFPGVIGVAVLLFLYRKFRFSNLVYFLIWLHCIVLFVGGHYTYAEMPLFNWIRDTFHLARNHYDRLGHFFQGFVPALIVREIFIRKAVVKKQWMVFLVLAVCLAISASYELLEWGTAEATGSAADAFLGSQGDVWDSQWDMFFCLIGAISALVFLSKAHNRQLRRLQSLRRGSED